MFIIMLGEKHQRRQKNFARQLFGRTASGDEAVKILFIWEVEGKYLLQKRGWWCKRQAIHVCLC